MNFDTQILDEEAAKEAKANVSLDIIAVSYTHLLLSFRRFYEIGEKDRPQTAGLDKLRYNANHRRWPVASKRGAFESLYRIRCV